MFNEAKSLEWKLLFGVLLLVFIVFVSVVIPFITELFQGVTDALFGSVGSEGVNTSTFIDRLIENNK